MKLHPSEIIKKKRGGEALSEAELSFLLDGFLQGQIKDYQIAAFLMAVYFQGMTSEETGIWARLMWRSGVSLPRKDSGEFWVDKHSTGGVGDKTSFLLVPLVHNVCRRLFGDGQVRIPMISGRGLDFTGGTLDKLEAVPGFTSDLEMETAMGLLDRNGFFMMGQTADLAPADRLLYALRDVTATVECVPLIVSSILSKKLAESLDGIVLDVKFGSGAFMPEFSRAQTLAHALTRVAREEKVASVALLTRMDEPLGFKVGHQLEIEECADFLAGEAREPGLQEVTLALAGQMVCLASRGKLSPEQGRAECEQELEKREVLTTFIQMFESQGGRWKEFKAQRYALGGRPRVSLISKHSGYLAKLDARSVGRLVRNLGGGRLTKESGIDLNVGVEIRRKVGDKVQAGESLLDVVLSEPHPQVATLLSQVMYEVQPAAVMRPRWVEEVIDA